MKGSCTAVKILLENTKCMTFDKSGILTGRNFLIIAVPLENVRTYKYLGVLLTPSSDRALKAFRKLKNNLGDVFNGTILTTLLLLHASIKPILLFSSDFWGCMKLPKSNPIENVYDDVETSTWSSKTDYEQWGYSGVPMELFAVQLGNWERIRHKQANTLLKKT